jgi:hypothetical protein
MYAVDCSSTEQFPLFLVTPRFEFIPNQASHLDGVK